MHPAAPRRLPGGAPAAHMYKTCRKFYTYTGSATHMPNVIFQPQKTIVLPSITSKVAICTFLGCLEAYMAKILNQNHQKPFQIGSKGVFNWNIYHGLYVIV